MSQYALTAHRESVWLSQRQIGELFATTPENVLMHLINTQKNQEIEEVTTTKNFLVVQTEGKRQVERKLKHYNLDAIISAGYRVNGKQDLQFRIWATSTLRDDLLQGYTLNRHRLKYCLPFKTMLIARSGSALNWL